MRKALFFTLLLIPILSFSQVTDHEGRTYKTVTIGNQTWMAENLNVSTFRNGDLIYLAEDSDTWWLSGEAGEPCIADIEFDVINSLDFGKLYNFFVIIDPRGIIPDGWRIPTDEDWSIFAQTLGGPEAATAKLKSAEGWLEENGTDESGFTAFPIGMIDMEGYFNDLGYGAYFWSSTVEDDLVLNRNLTENKFPFEKAQSNFLNGMSIRLIKIN